MPEIIAIGNLGEHYRFKNNQSGTPGSLFGLDFRAFEGHLVASHRCRRSGRRSAGGRGVEIPHLPTGGYHCGGPCGEGRRCFGGIGHGRKIERNCA